MFYNNKIETRAGEYKTRLDYKGVDNVGAREAIGPQVFQNFSF